MLHYNLPLLLELLTNIGRLVKTSVTLYDEHFNPTKAFSSNFENPLCNTLKSSVYHKCQLSDLKAQKHLIASNDPFYCYTCHLGLTEMAFRLSKEDKTYAYIIIGPFRDPAKDDEILSTIEKLCVSAHYDYDKLSKDYLNLTEFTPETFEALKFLIYPLFEYTVTKNIITLKSGTFSSVIEPYILQNLDQDLSVESLCKNFYMSEKALYNFFKENTEKSPKQYIIEQRILAAKKLIYSTDQALPSIAASVGFNDYNYFIKVFKQHVHKTPMHYRKSKK